MTIQANQQEFNLNNNNNQIHEPLLMSTALSIVSKTIEQLLAQSFDQLREKQLLKLTPNFSQQEVMGIFNIYLYQMTPNYGTTHPCGLQQEDVTNITKIEKDNLSPKQLSTLDSQHLHTITNLPDHIPYPMPTRRPSITNSRMIMRKPSLMSSQLISGSTTERTNKIQRKLSSTITNDQHATCTSANKLSRSIALRRDPLRNFTPLLAMQQQQQQPQNQQATYLRQKVAFNTKQRQREQNVINQRIRLQAQKIKCFNSIIGTKGSFTFEFNGQPLGSLQSRDDEKIKCFEMNVDVNKFSRKYRTMYKHLQLSRMDKVVTRQLQQQQQQPSSVTSKPSRTRQIPIIDEVTQFPISEIPKFTNNNINDQQQRLVNDRCGRLRVEEYRKLYGRRFSRYDHHPSYTTMDVYNIQESNKSTIEDDSIMSRKHLTDSREVSKKGRSPSVNKSYMATKLALPRLQGTYKMLDRYKQV